MQIKAPLRYFSKSHAVYAAVKNHFEARGRQLPMGWEALVALACFPKQLRRNPKIWKPARASILSFRKNWARDTDLTLEILCFTRKVLTSLSNPVSDKNRVRTFLLEHPTLVREKGALRLLRYSDAGKKAIKLVRVDSSAVQDGELATLIFGSKSSSKVETVKKIRQSLSWKKVNGEMVFVIPDFLKG